MTRELIAADARSDLERDDAPARVARLLGAALSSLSATAGAILRYEAAPRTPSALAVHGVSPEALELLEGREGKESLAQRSCSERRLFVLDRASREPLMSSLRASGPDLAAAAVVPLYDRSLPVAALLLAAEDARILQAASLRLLTPAFHLLGVLLSPGRVGSGALRGEERSEALDQERYVVELEELGNLLHEARSAARLAAEQAAATEAEHRAVIESSRARISELEALASRAEVESSLRHDLESAYAAQGRRIEERERRIAELQVENRDLQRRIDELEAGASRESAGVHIADTRSRSDAGEAGAEEPDGEGGLQEMADAAAAALADVVAEDADGETTPAAPLDGGAGDAPPAVFTEVSEATAGESEAAARASVDDTAATEVEDVPQIAAELPLVLLALDGDSEMREAMLSAAERAGVVAWAGEGDPPAGRGLLTVNLFDAMLGRVSDLLQAGAAGQKGLAYGRDAESGTGFELGSVSWITRPIDTSAAVAHVRSLVPARASGIVIISAQLRDLSPLREALSAAGVSSSVACDARQAFDLLDIVRSPDALLVDLSLDGGQGLTIAIQSRSQNETRDTPLLLLLPAHADPERLLAGARRAVSLSTFGPPEVGRMVTAALSRR